MKKFKSKKKRKNILFYIIIIFIIYFLFIKLMSNINLSTNNKEFINNMLDDQNYYKKYKRKNYVNYLTKYILNIDSNNPKNILKSVFNYKKSNNKIEASYVMNESDPIVYIYNTHDTEMYNGEYLNNYDISPNVKMASYLLEGLLNKESIKTIVEENSMKDYLNNNNLPYSESYQASRHYLKDKMIKYPNLKLIIDLHRDSINKDRSTIKIDNKSYAKVLFVVGENNNHFIDNYNLANTLNDIIKNKYSGISRGVLTKKGTGIRGRFNQDISPNIVLIECGGEDNTIDEVMNTMVAIKDMIKSYLGDLNG